MASSSVMTIAPRARSISVTILRWHIRSSGQKQQSKMLWWYWRLIITSQSRHCNATGLALISAMNCGRYQVLNAFWFQRPARCSLRYLKNNCSLGAKSFIRAARLRTELFLNDFSLRIIKNVWSNSSGTQFCIDVTRIMPWLLQSLDGIYNKTLPFL